MLSTVEIKFGLSCNTIFKSIVEKCCDSILFKPDNKYAWNIQSTLAHGFSCTG